MSLYYFYVKQYEKNEHFGYDKVFGEILPKKGIKKAVLKKKRFSLLYGFLMCREEPWLEDEFSADLYRLKRRGSLE